MSWLEPPIAEEAVDEEHKPDSPRASDAPRRPSRPVPQRRETMDVRLEWLEPEPVDSQAAAPKARRSSAAPPKRARQPWEPPTLPPPPANAVKPRRALPPPLPREEGQEARKRPSRRPNKG